MARELKVADFQQKVKGQQTDLFFLENKSGLRAAITNYGARIVAIWVPDRYGKPDNVVAGYATLQDYLRQDETYMGAIVGRYANRISRASFELENKTYSLTANEGDHHLHGGKQAFHNVVWEAEQFDINEVVLNHISPDGAEGFPGKLEIEVRYSLTDSGELTITTVAISDKDTVLNITNHSYFNLTGEEDQVPARDHLLQIDADHYLPVGSDKIPIGSIEPVESTPFNFKNYRKIEKALQPEHPQLAIGGGYDHCFVLNKKSGNSYTSAASVKDPASGRYLAVYTTEPGLQFFECIFPEDLEVNLPSAYCLETQHFPDSPNRPEFPSTLLKAGKKYHSKTSYVFGTDSRKVQNK